MGFFARLNGYFNRYLAVIVLVVGLGALLAPQAFVWASAYTSIFLGLVMFTMGLTMKPHDFSEVFKHPLQVLLVAVVQFGFMPAAAYVVAKLLNLPQEIALGLIFVGCAPGGTSSNVISFLANGNVALSVSATSVSTLLSPFMTPLLLAAYGGAYIEIAFWPMFLSIVRIVLLPIVLGIVINYFAGERLKGAQDFLPSLSSLAVLLVLAGSVAINAETLKASGWVILAAVLIHNISGYLAGYLVCKFRHYDIPSTRAIAIEIGMQNGGLASTLALQHFNPNVALAGAATTVLHTLVGTLYASACQRKDQKAPLPDSEFYAQAEASEEEARVLAEEKI